MNYVELMQMLKTAGAGAAEQDFRNQYEAAYQKAMEGKGKLDRWAGDTVVKPYVDARLNPLVADAKTMAQRDQLIGGGVAGLAGAGLSYGGLGLIPGLKKRKLLRALAAVAGGAGAGLFIGNNVGKASFGNRLTNSINDPAARAAAYGRVSDRVNKSLGDIAKAEGYQGSVPKIKYTGGAQNIKRAAYAGTTTDSIVKNAALQPGKMINNTRTNWNNLRNAWRGVRHVSNLQSQAIREGKTQLVNKLDNRLYKQLDRVRTNPLVRGTGNAIGLAALGGGVAYGTDKLLRNYYANRNQQQAPVTTQQAPVA